MNDGRNIVKNYSAPVLGRRSYNDEFKFYGTLLSLGESSYAVDGVGILNGKLVVEESDLFEVDKDFDFMSMKGSLSIYTETMKDGVLFFKINPDPIGACFVYSYDKDGVVAFSSDLQHLIDWLKSQDVTVAKSTFYQAMILAIGDGAFGYTSYDDVFALESSKYIFAYRNQYKTLDYGVEEYFKGDDTYDNLLNSAANDIEETIKAISLSKYNKIAHLTGGMDSRLVISAISSSKQLNEYKVFCSGQHGYPDFDTAYALCSVLNAKMTNEQTLSQHKIPQDFEEYYKWSSSDNLGMVPNQPTNTGMVGKNDTLVVSGGYGECLRGYNLHCTDKTLDFIIENLWPLHNSDNKVRVPVQEEVVEKIKNALGSFLIAKLEKGWSLNDALQLLYIQEKNRYFVGNISKSFSKYTPRIDPLYSLFAFKAAYKLSDEDRANRVLMYDLMNRFDSKLACLKFGTTSWPKQLKQKRNFESEELPTKPNVLFENHPSKNSIDWLTKVSSQSKKEAIRLGAPPWQVHHYQHIQKLSKSIIAKNPLFFESFDKVRTMRLLNNKLENRQNIRKVFQLYYALVWLYQ